MSDTPIHDSIEKDREDAAQTKELADSVRRWIDQKEGK